MANSVSKSGVRLRQGTAAAMKIHAAHGHVGDVAAIIVPDPKRARTPHAWHRDKIRTTLRDRVQTQSINMLSRVFRAGTRIVAHVNTCSIGQNCAGVLIDDLIRERAERHRWSLRVTLVNAEIGET